MPSVTRFDLLAERVLKRIDLEKFPSNLICPVTCFERGPNFAKHFLFPSFLAVSSVESRSVHLSTLVQEAQQRVMELSAQAGSEGLGTESSEREKQLKGWEWRARLYQRMKDGYEHAREYPAFPQPGNGTQGHCSQEGI